MTSGQGDNDGNMSKRQFVHTRVPGRSFFLCTFLVLSSLNLMALDSRIDINEYQLDDYVRHPRMEEEDRLRGGNPHFRPGLEIITDVDDVEIRFFEEKVGRTPAEWDNLKAGAYRVGLERTGFDTMEFWVSVKSDRRTVVEIRMGDPAGGLTVSGLPPGGWARIDREEILDGTYKGTPGRKTLSAGAFGWETLQEVIEIRSGEETVWNYTGSRLPFEISSVMIRPKSLPASDNRGFHLDIEATAPGSARIIIQTSEGTELAQMPVLIHGKEVRYYGSPGDLLGSKAQEGTYTLLVEGQGVDGNLSRREIGVNLDNRFKRQPRPGAYLLPGLVYAAGTSMLPPGIWQTSTGAGGNIDLQGSESDGIPAWAAFRLSPAAGWEVGGKFSIEARDPFEMTSIGFSLFGTWRMNRVSGHFQSNLSLSYMHEGYASDFATIPNTISSPDLPGLGLHVPMSLSFGNWTISASPALHLSFLGSNPSLWRLGAPPAFYGSLGLGAYYEEDRWLTGFSMKIRSADAPSGLLDWTLWNGVEGRFDLPGDASYLALYVGIRYLDDPAVLSLGLEFGVCR